MIERQTAHLAAYLILEKDGKVLLLRRFNTGWGDGSYTVPAGHVDLDEKIVTTMVREAEEECGVHIAEKDLDMVHVLHINTDKDYVCFFFSAKTWEGEPRIVEPDKSDDMQWFSLDALPENTLPFVKNVLEDYKKGISFSERLFEEKESEVKNNE
jgi:8-oxo-dGTP pyrophosphatase MutT (NUDIX family)